MFFIYTKDFFNHLRSELHSERTIETYCQSLNAFRIYLYETYSKTVDQITTEFVTEEIIREFLSSVADSNSIGTRNVRLSGIKAYLKYAATRDMELVPLQINISAIKHKKTYPKRHNWLDKADVELILAQPPQTKIGIRDRFIILFLFSTGARLAEMRSVQLKDVIINEKYPYIRITGKGNKPRIVPIPEDSFLENYKYYCRLYHPKGEPESYLFYPTASPFYRTAHIVHNNIAYFLKYITPLSLLYPIHQLPKPAFLAFRSDYHICHNTISPFFMDF